MKHLFLILLSTFSMVSVQAQLLMSPDENQDVEATEQPAEPVDDKKAAVEYLSNEIENQKLLVTTLQENLQENEKTIKVSGIEMVVLGTILHSTLRVNGIVSRSLKPVSQWGNAIRLIVAMGVGAKLFTESGDVVIAVSDRAKLNKKLTAERERLDVLQMVMDSQK